MEQRQDVNKGCVVPMSELLTQVTEAVRARRMRKAKTRTNQKYLKMSRKQLENFLEQERRHNLEHPLQDLQSVQRKATKKRQFANGTRLTWPGATGSAPRNVKNKGSARKTRRNKWAEEGSTYRQDVGISIRKWSISSEVRATLLKDQASTGIQKAKQDKLAQKAKLEDYKKRD